MFAHGVAFQSQSVSVVHQAVEDGIGEGGLVDVGVPLVPLLSLRYQPRYIHNYVLIINVTYD